MNVLNRSVLAIVLSVSFVTETTAQGTLGTVLEELLNDRPEALAAEAETQGDPVRGALVFSRPELACRRCHALEASPEDPIGLGPNLAKMGPDIEASYLIESILHPSKEIREGYESRLVALVDGRLVTGLVIDETPDQLSLRDPDGNRLDLDPIDIEASRTADESLMPAGLIATLSTRQEFLDLASYVIAIARGGLDRAIALEPDPALLAPQPLPEYEANLDHRTLIARFDQESYLRGEAIYQRVCANCHGTLDRVGSLPTSPRFAEAKLKNGSDPFSIYQTLTRGYGKMMPQTWMVPQQKYDVIHYIRQTFFNDRNPSLYTSIDESYLAALPEGTEFGPEPSEIEPWVAMDYGPFLINTYEIGDDGSNFAHKGIALRLDTGSGGISRGRHWMIFDHDTMRMAAAWSGQGFIDWAGIHFDGRHGIHPRIVGQVQASNPTGPGWGSPEGSFEDQSRVLGRDGKQYGPLPSDWADFQGIAVHGDQVLIDYKVGESSIRELPGLIETDQAPVFTRSFAIGPRSEELVLQVAHLETEETLPEMRELGSETILFAPPLALPGGEESRTRDSSEFDGKTMVLVDAHEGAELFDFDRRDLTITARIRTESGGTIWSLAPSDGDWVPDAKALFVRDGRLVFDLGWVGAVTGKTPIDDGRWHDIALTYQHRNGRVELYVDDELDARGALKPKNPVQGHVDRLGFAAPDIHAPDSIITGQMAHVTIFDRVLDQENLERLGRMKSLFQPIAKWDLAEATPEVVPDQSPSGLNGQILHGEPVEERSEGLVAGLSDAPEGCRWVNDGENLRLLIPAGPEAIRFSLWFAGLDDPSVAETLVTALQSESITGVAAIKDENVALRYPEVVTTAIEPGASDGPFAVDVLPRPASNPWNAQVRPSGLDFLPGGDAAIVTAWDGDVWRVDGILANEGTLRWRRIATGLFQPLGVKIIDDAIYVNCRDQIVILRDRNADGEMEYYECFTNDHQVTEHFHEFAMDLQVDDDGYLYYAKGGRHALRAVVPQHGTLLRVSPDGSKTEVIATGFRAPNGVCLNPDGTFFLTDQEGHWTPKNRINRVREGGFYGYLWGYTEVTDTSDSAMERPICWITNSMDRSPAQILRVESSAWPELNDSYLELSYGTGKIMVVPFEEVDGVEQGGVCALPIPQFPTGVMRGRFHPVDGQLYACGLFSWAGDRQQPGGMYRVRSTGIPPHVPVELHAWSDGLAITFSAPIDPESVTPGRFQIQAWNIERAQRYGSEHQDERRLEVTSADLANDRRTVLLEIPEITPTRGMSVQFNLRGENGTPVRNVLHNTIYRLGAGSIFDITAE